MNIPQLLQVFPKTSRVFLLYAKCRNWFAFSRTSRFNSANDIDDIPSMIAILGGERNSNYTVRRQLATAANAAALHADAYAHAHLFMQWRRSGSMEMREDTDGLVEMEVDPGECPREQSALAKTREWRVRLRNGWVLRETLAIFKISAPMVSMCLYVPWR